MIISVNRGLWISLLIGAIYVAVRRASSGQLLLAIRLVLILTFAFSIALVSPLGELIGGRTTSSHSLNARGDIYADVIEAVPESPIVGFGAPVANPDPNRPAIGTHGMFWTALFSQGIPGAILYVGFWLGMAIRTGRGIRNQEQLWLHLAVASALPTMFFYDHLPAALPLMMIAAAVLLRDRRRTSAEASTPTRSSGSTSCSDEIGCSVLDSALLKSDPKSSVRRVTDFLGLPAIAGGDYPLYNQRERDPVSPELRERYGHLFDESNDRLRQLLLPGDLSWL